MLLGPYVANENDFYALIRTLWETRKSLLLAGPREQDSLICITKCVLWYETPLIGWIDRLLEVTGSLRNGDLAEVISEVTGAKKRKTETNLHFCRNNPILINFDQNHFSSTCFKTWLWIWRLLGMCKDYYSVLVQVERNYKLIQNLAINRQE